jgi:hypothetical protein
LSDKDYYGTPVEVSTPELRFRVEKPTSPDRPRQKVDPLNDIFEPGLEFNSMGTRKFPPRGEGYYNGNRKRAAHLPERPGEPVSPESQNIVPSSTPWLLFAVLVMAVFALLWLWLKKHRKIM